jgi:hypothetical protein
MKIEWENFVTILKSSGIHLKNTNDKIVWTWNRSTGEVTANLAYQSISQILKSIGRKKMVVQSYLESEHTS